MTITYVTVTVFVAAANTYGAVVDLTRADWVVANMSRLGVPDTRLVTLGWLKAAGALGLVAGVAVPWVGIAAATGLVSYFVGAIVTVGRARWYEHLPYPIAFLLLSVAALVLRLATL